MTELRIASLLSERFNAKIAKAAPFAEIIGVDWSRLAAIPSGAAGLLALPPTPGEPVPSAPAGWPFSLKWIQLVSAGVDLYPDWMLDNLIVTTSRGTSADAIAEFVLAAIFAQAKRLPDIWISDAAQWRPARLSNVSGATLGVFGFGAIGARLAGLAHAVGMTILVVKRTDGDLPPYVERVASIEALAARSDHLALAAPLTQETEGAVNDQVFGAAKPGLHLINVARGAMIDEGALLRALDSGAVSIATLDVAHPEPLPAGHPFYVHPKIRLSPHTSTYTPDQSPKILEVILRNLEHFAAGRPLTNVFDKARGY